MQSTVSIGGHTLGGHTEEDIDAHGGMLAVRLQYGHVIEIYLVFDPTKVHDFTSFPKCKQRN